jgi:hypothetical protein
MCIATADIRSRQRLVGAMTPLTNLAERSLESAFSGPKSLAWEAANMRNMLFLTAVAALLAGAGISLPAAASASASEWQIGPIVRSRNYSVGMPLTPTRTPEGWSFEFPHASPRAGHVHALTTRTGPLHRKSRMIVRYRIDAAPGVRIAPRENPRAQATLSLFIQRHGDNWTARGPFQYYRWYATHSNRVALTPGEHEIVLDLNGANWKSVVSATGDQAGGAFRDALVNAERIGFVFGGGGSAGHGVYATGPARFTLLSFRVI